MKTSMEKGTESIFALVNDDMFQNQDEWNSISIIPSFSSKNRIINTNMSEMMDGWDDQHHDDSLFPMFEDIAWHQYVIEWTPDYLSYSIDGTEYRHKKFRDSSY